VSRYTIGVDFGTESGRAVLVDVADGRQLATAVYSYANGVIDERLPVPDHEIPLPPDWALQDPEDYIDSGLNGATGCRAQAHHVRVVSVALAKR
jgi:L-ribulokinase